MGAGGWGEGSEELGFNKDSAAVWGDGTLWRWMVVIVAQNANVLNTTDLYTKNGR